MTRLLNEIRRLLAGYAIDLVWRLTPKSDHATLLAIYEVQKAMVTAHD